MNYTRILFTIALTGIAVSSYAMHTIKRGGTIVYHESGTIPVVEDGDVVYPWPGRMLVKEDGEIIYPWPGWQYGPALTYTDTIGYKDKLKRVQKQLEKEKKEVRHSYEVDTSKYNRMFADIALNSRDMPELEKLEYLLGPTRYEERKKIILSLIKSGTNPNHFAYQGTTALEEGIKEADFCLVSRLLKAGVRPFQKDIEQAQRSSYIDSLDIGLLLGRYGHLWENIHEYKGVFFKKNDNGDILPLWQDIPPAQLKDKLTEFVLFMQTMPGISCIIEIPSDYDNACVFEIFKQLCFVLHYVDNEKMELIYKNE